MDGASKLQCPADEQELHTVQGQAFSLGLCLGSSP